ncbi:MAG TPA: aminotransferase class IV [Bacteroidales bacterium]|nr:aminotransferase class IV [Bacteroidales bacterium]
MEYLRQFIIVDGKETENLPIDKYERTIIYEVIRILAGTPLFLEKHIQRLNNSARILDKNIPFSVTEFSFLIKKLIGLNNSKEGNVKISIEYNGSSAVSRSIIGFIPHKYPSIEEYQIGVKTISSVNLRLNPKAKVQNEKLRNELNQIISDSEAYEALLVHPDGYITEGSRSNIFFVQGSCLITSPDNQVLSGITRENVIQICKENKYNLVMRSLSYSELPDMDAAFLTGTSPKVLPVKSIDKLTFKLPNELTEEIMRKYDRLIQTYITKY